MINGFGRYLTISLFPFFHRLTFSDLQEFTSLSLFTLFGLFGLLAFLFLYFRSSFLRSLGSGVFLFSLLPACNIFPPGLSYLSERLLYLPSLGIIILAFSLIRRFSKSPIFFFFSFAYLLAMALGYQSGD